MTAAKAARAAVRSATAVKAAATRAVTRVAARVGIRTRAARPRRVPVPTVLQMEALECGAASLAMVLRFFGLVIPLEELRIACGVSRDGSKASNILKAARRYSLTAAGYKKEPHQLREMPMPVIVHWNFNHFLVVEGFSDRWVFLNDPSGGPRKTTIDEFDRAFTGVVLTFAPNSTFAKGGEGRSLVKALQRRLAGSRLALLYVVLAGLALVVPGLVNPAFSKVFIDDVLVRGAVTWARPLLLLMGVTAIVIALLTWLQQHYLLRVETKLALSTSSKFFWHVLRLPVSFFIQRNAGEIGGRVAINDRIAALLSGQLATTALNIVVLAFYAGLMLQYDVALTLVGIFVAGLNMAALKYVSRKRVDLNQRLLQDRGRLLGVAAGGLQTIETLKASGSESDFFSRWAGYQAKVINAHHQLELQTQLLSAVPPLLLTLNTTVMLWLGGTRVMDGRMSMGTLIAFQALMITFLLPVGRLVELGSTLQEARGDMDRLDDVLRCKAEPVAMSEGPDAGTVTTAVKLNGELTLRDVSFGYSPLEPPLIENFNLTLKPGSRVALVGGSGCGKSTVARLVCGLYEPWTGEILFDGVPRADVPRALLINSFAVVDQDIFLFSDSIQRNLTLWDATISEADVARAARDACIHEDIAARQGGYMSMAEEGGRNFSGGQRQRMEIARALVGNPRILVLDEATSALDPQTEQLIDDHIRRRGCTCLIIAHRLSTIRDCDEIVVLDRGRIVQRGTHAQMRAVDGPYKRLIGAE
jgi:NHLM bacteriocin system ABC transporter peptidase/ATP-binding protein